MRTRHVLAATALAFVSVAGLAVGSTSGAFQAGVTNTSNTAAAAYRFSCTAAFASPALRSSTYFAYSLGGTGGTETDLGTAGNTGTYTSGHTTVAVGAADACPRDVGSAPNAWRLNGTSDWLSTTTQTPTPGDFALVVSFRTSAPTGAAKSQYLLGYNATRSALTSQQKDRHLYVDVNGYLQFGVYNGGFQMANTTGNSFDGNTPAQANGVKVTDGQWHTAIAVSTAGKGLALWLDGTLMGTTGRSSADQYSGYWRIGAGALDGWPNTSDDGNGNHFPGDVRFAAAFSTSLTDSQVKAISLDAAAGS